MALVMVDEEEWQESHTGLTISLQMRGTSRAKVDILQTDTYIKVVQVYTVKKTSQGFGKFFLLNRVFFQFYT
jgi:hypothetical protein